MLKCSKKNGAILVPYSRPIQTNPDQLERFNLKTFKTTVQNRCSPIYHILRNLQIIYTQRERLGIEPSSRFSVGTTVLKTAAGTSRTLIPNSDGIQL